MASCEEGTCSLAVRSRDIRTHGTPSGTSPPSGFVIPAWGRFADQLPAPASSNLLSPDCQVQLLASLSSHQPWNAVRHAERGVGSANGTDAMDFAKRDVAAAHVRLLSAEPAPAGARPIRWAASQTFPALRATAPEAHVAFIAPSPFGLDNAARRSLNVGHFGVVWIAPHVRSPATVSPPTRRSRSSSASSCWCWSSSRSQSGSVAG